MDKSPAGANVPTDRFKLLYDISKDINSSLDLDEVLNTVMDKILLLVRAERGFIMLIDEEGTLEFRIARDIGRGTIGEEEFPPSRSIVEPVVKSLEPVLTFSALDDPRFSSSKSIVAFGLRSIMCVPMLVPRHRAPGLDRHAAPEVGPSKGELKGVIYVENRMKAGVFKQDDLELLETFSSLAGTAIDNARLFADLRRSINDLQTTKNYMEAIYESVSSGIISLDLDGAITTFNKAAEKVFGVDRHNVLGQPESAIFHEVAGEEIVALIGAVVTTGETVTGKEVPYTVTPGHNVTLNISLSPLVDSQNQQIGVAVVTDDITEKRRYDTIKNLFGRFVSPQVMDELTRDPDKVQLGGQERMVSILFSDINDFTPTCERLPARQIIEMLNEYFREMNRIIFHHNGTIKQFVGDEIMVMYGAPGAQEDHAVRAVRTAVEMIRRLRFLEESGDGKSGFYDVKIGIHTGKAIVGNVGSEERSEYAAVGDAVNLASRILGLNKFLDTTLLISDATYQTVALALWEEAEFIDHGEQTVKGKVDTIRVWEVRPR